MVFMVYFVHWDSWICKCMSFTKFGIFAPIISFKSFFFKDWSLLQSLFPFLLELKLHMSWYCPICLWRFFSLFCQIGYFLWIYLQVHWLLPLSSTLFCPFRFLKISDIVFFGFRIFTYSLFMVSISLLRFLIFTFMVSIFPSLSIVVIAA